MLKRRSRVVNIDGFPYFLSILFLVLYYSLCNTVASYPFLPPPANTHAERALRPAVISCKTSFGHRSSHGAFLQAPFMSLFQTWHIRHPAPLSTCVASSAVTSPPPDPFPILPLLFSINHSAQLLRILIGSNTSRHVF